jgi:hypothetical protein
MCGAVFEADSPRRKYCHGEECNASLADRKNVRRKLRRSRLSQLGIKLHSKGNS